MRPRGWVVIDEQLLVTSVEMYRLLRDEFHLAAPDGRKQPRQAAMPCEGVDGIGMRPPDPPVNPRAIGLVGGAPMSKRNQRFINVRIRIRVRKRAGRKRPHAGLTVAAAESRPVSSDIGRVSHHCRDIVAKISGGP